MTTCLIFTTNVTLNIVHFVALVYIHNFNVTFDLRLLLRLLFCVRGQRIHVRVNAILHVHFYEKSVRGLFSRE